MDTVRKTLFRIVTTAILLFLIVPVIAIVPMSFSSGEYFIYPLPGLSLRWYVEIAQDPRWTRAFTNSLLVGFVSAAVATVLGTLAALGLARTKAAFARVAFAVLLAPMLVAIVIVSVSLFFYYSYFGLVGSRLGLVLSHATLGLPFVVITVLATLRTYNFNLDRAAESLGASKVYTFFTITLPVIAPGVISGALFAFAVSLDEVVVTLFLASPEHTTLPREIYGGLRESISPAVIAAATITIALSCLLMVALGVLNRYADRMR